MTYCGWHTYNSYKSTMVKYSWVGLPGQQLPQVSGYTSALGVLLHWVRRYNGCTANCLQHYCILHNVPSGGVPSLSFQHTHARPVI